MAKSPQAMLHDAYMELEHGNFGIPTTEGERVRIAQLRSAFRACDAEWQKVRRGREPEEVHSELQMRAALRRMVDDIVAGDDTGSGDEVTEDDHCEDCDG